MNNCALIKNNILPLGSKFKHIVDIEYVFTSLKDGTDGQADSRVVMRDGISNRYMLPVLPYCAV